MSDKKQSRIRRAKRSRCKIRELGMKRLTVYRTPRHIYAQVISEQGDRVIASASSCEKELRSGAGNVDSAEKVGKLIAERAVGAGVSDVAFDRSGYQYHGRVKALADAARAGGLKF